MSENVFASLKTLFHEPSRLAIVSHLAGAERGASFSQLKQSCGLTDGNLSRHLAALEKEKLVRVEKSFIDNKPQTKAVLTAKGRKGLLAYLQSLEEALQEAAKRVSGLEKNEKQQDKAKGAISLLGKTGLSTK